MCAVVVIVLAALGASAVAAESITIEGLLKGGWQVIGYAGTLDNRSTLVLFRHPTETYLVQCAVTNDVLRNPRTMSNCYELR